LSHQSAIPSIQTRVAGSSAPEASSPPTSAGVSDLRENPRPARAAGRLSRAEARRVRSRPPGIAAALRTAHAVKKAKAKAQVRAPGAALGRPAGPIMQGQAGN
jgi:hypothetical protein